MTNIQTAISAINSKFDQAMHAKNTAQIGQLYADNAVLMPAPAGEIVSGRGAIETFFLGLITAGVIDHKLTLTEAIEEGNLAYQRGLWSAAMLDTAGARQSFGGNVLLVYRKQANGSWLAISHIWN
jgi:ketosteroid isomerase-like protein